MIPSCQTLSKAIEISKNTPLTSLVGSQSKEELISLIIDSKFEMQESPGKNPDWQFVKNLFLWKQPNRCLKSILSNIFPNIGSKLIGL